MNKFVPEVAEFILCEEIREEVNGKISIMGLYRDQIAFLEGAHSTWPRPLRHAVHVRIRGLPSETLKCTLRVEAQDKVLFDHSDPFTPPLDLPTAELNINANLNINVPGYGELITRILVENETGKLLLEKTRPLRIVPHGTLTGDNSAERSE